MQRKRKDPGRRKKKKTYSVRSLVSKISCVSQASIADDFAGTGSLKEADFHAKHQAIKNLIKAWQKILHVTGPITLDDSNVNGFVIATREMLPGGKESSIFNKMKNGKEVTIEEYDQFIDLMIDAVSADYKFTAEQKAEYKEKIAKTFADDCYETASIIRSSVTDDLLQILGLLNYDIKAALLDHYSKQLSCALESIRAYIRLAVLFEELLLNFKDE